MAIYRVLLDGVDIYDPTSKGMVLIDPVVHTDAGAAGNFEFTMPPMHVFYNNITPYGSSIEVLEDGQSIFFGRPLKPKIGFYNQKTYHCEGALAFLNDSRPVNEFVYEDTTPVQYFHDLIDYHNAMQDKDSRKFTVGNITVSTDWDVYREMSPSMTILEHIKRGCIGSDGGYLFTRRVGGVTYIDWEKDMPYTCNQTVEFALNLLDMSRSGNEDIYTGVMLKGGERRIKQNGRVSNSVVKYGPLWGNAEAIAKYGNIIGYKEYTDITNVDDLIAAGEVYLMTQQFESMIFEVTAAEQHYLNASLDMFRTGQKVHLVSNPHFVDIVLPVQSVEVRLDSAEKKVTLGTQRRQTLTKIQRIMKEEQDKVIQDTDNAINALDIADSAIEQINTDVGDLIDNQGTVIGDDGYRYDVGVDSDGNVYATKLPIGMVIAVYKSRYSPSSIYDGTNNVVNVTYKEGEEPENVTQNCEFFIRYDNGGVIAEVSADGFVFPTSAMYSLVAKYAIKERMFEAFAPIRVAGIIAAIHIVIKPHKLEYLNGEVIEYDGIHVYALDENGSVYKDDRYPTGEIPFDELILPETITDFTKASNVRTERPDHSLSGTVTVTSVGSIMNEINEAETKSGVEIDDEHGYIDQIKASVAQYDGRCVGSARIWYGQSSYDGWSPYTVIIYTGIKVGDTVRINETYNSIAYRTRGTKQEGDKPIKITQMEVVQGNTNLSIGQWTEGGGNSIVSSSLNAESIGDQTIPVQWNNPDSGTTLEDTFDISVKGG